MAKLHTVCHRISNSHHKLISVLKPPNNCGKKQGGENRPFFHSTVCVVVEVSGSDGALKTEFLFSFSYFSSFLTKGGRERWCATQAVHMCEECIGAKPTLTRAHEWQSSILCVYFHFPKFLLMFLLCMCSKYFLRAKI